MKPSVEWLERPVERTMLAAAAALLCLPLLGVLLPLLSFTGAAGGPASFAPALGGRQLLLLARSIVFSSAVASVATMLGLAIAAALLRHRAGWFVPTLLLPALILVPPTIHGLCWTTALQATGDWLVRHGFSKVHPTGWGAAAAVEVLSLLPIAVAVAWAGLSLIDRKLLEAGLVFRREPAVMTAIAFRLAGPVLWAGAVVLFLHSLSDYSVPTLFSFSVYALEIFSAYSTGFHPAAAVFIAAPLSAVIVFAVITGLLAGRRAGAMTLSLRTRTSRAEAESRSGAPLFWAAICLLLLQLFFPMAVMSTLVGSWRYVPIALTSARGEIVVSFLVALGAAALCVLLAPPLARALDAGLMVSGPWWILAVLAFALPAPLMGIGIIQAAGVLGRWTEEWLPVWANSARFLPVAAFICYGLRKRRDAGMLEAAQVFGRSRWNAWARVALPLMLPGMAVSAAVCFSLTIGELGATLLVAAPGRATLMMRLYGLLHYGASRDVAALSLMLSLLSMAAGVLLTLMLHRRMGAAPWERSHG